MWLPSTSSISEHMWSALVQWAPSPTFLSFPYFTIFFLTPLTTSCLKFSIKKVQCGYKGLTKWVKINRGHFFSFVKQYDHNKTFIFLLCHINILPEYFKNVFWRNVILVIPCETNTDVFFRRKQRQGNLGGSLSLFITILYMGQMKL